MAALAELDHVAEVRIKALERDLGVWLVVHAPGDAAGPPLGYTRRVRTAPPDERALQRIRELEQRLSGWLVAYDASAQE